MKKLVISLAILLTPVSALAYTGTWSFNSTSTPNYYPNSVFGIAPAVWSDHFVATSTTATSTFAGDIKITNALANLITDGIKTLDSSGLDLYSSNGSIIGLFGAGGGQNATFYDGLTNYGTLTTNIVNATGTGISYFMGSVGIGTTSPSAKLHVYGSSATGDLLVNNTSSAGSISLASLLAPSATADTYFSVGRALSTANAALIGHSTTGGGKYAFLTTYGRPASDFVVNSTGNVGIGTTSPSNKLEVAGNGYFTGNITGANITATGTLNVTGQTTLANASTTNLTVGTNTFLTGLTSTVLAVDANHMIIATTTGGGSGSGTVNSGTTGQVAYYAGNGTAVSGTSTLIISNQKVGIGSSTPGNLLSVYGGKTTLAGTSGVDGEAVLSILRSDVPSRYININPSDGTNQSFNFHTNTGTPHVSFIGGTDYKYDNGLVITNSSAVSTIPNISGETHIYTGTYFDPGSGIFSSVKLSANAGANPASPFTAGVNGTASANLNTYGGYFNNSSVVSGTGVAYGIYAIGAYDYFSGNVGIGTTSPISTLAVVGTTTITNAAKVDYTNYLVCYVNSTGALGHMSTTTAATTGICQPN